VNGSVFEVMLAVGFGLLGYLLTKLDLEPAPLVLGFVLGPLIEEHLRRALTISDGDLTVFATRPLAATLIVLALLVPCLVLLPRFGRQRAEIFRAED
jgi:putative tricarboxylic transport membrane protein